jgi:hypothetical protein
MVSGIVCRPRGQFGHQFQRRLFDTGRQPDAGTKVFSLNTVDPEPVRQQAKRPCRFHRFGKTETVRRIVEHVCAQRFCAGVEEEQIARCRAAPCGVNKDDIVMLFKQIEQRVPSPAWLRVSRPAACSVSATQGPTPSSIRNRLPMPTISGNCAARSDTIHRQFQKMRGT